MNQRGFEKCNAVEACPLKMTAHLRKREEVKWLGCVYVLKDPGSAHKWRSSLNPEWPFTLPSSVIVPSLRWVRARTLCDPMDCSTPGFPVLHCLLEFAQTQVHWIGDAMQPSHPLLSPSPALNFSQLQGLFQWVGSLHWWLKYWSFSISPSTEYSGLISFRIDWFDLLAAQGLSRVSSSTTLFGAQAHKE